MNIGEYLKTRRLITDGAMGTYYAKWGGKESLVSEWANIKEPEIIAEIHRAYLAAGASLIRTNTFAVGRQTLRIDGEQQEEIVRAACRIAKAEIKAHTVRTGKPCFLAGDIGPLREFVENGETTDAESEYRALVDLFLEEGVSALLSGYGRNGKGGKLCQEKIPVHILRRVILRKSERLFGIGDSCKPLDCTGYTVGGTRCRWSKLRCWIRTYVTYCGKFAFAKRKIFLCSSQCWLSGTIAKSHGIYAQ